MRAKQIPAFWVGVYMAVLAIKEYSTLRKYSRTGALPPDMFNIIARKLILLPRMSRQRNFHLNNRVINVQVIGKRETN